MPTSSSHFGQKVVTSADMAVPNLFLAIQSRKTSSHKYAPDQPLLRIAGKGLSCHKYAPLPQPCYKWRIDADVPALIQLFRSGLYFWLRCDCLFGLFFVVSSSASSASSDSSTSASVGAGAVAGAAAAGGVDAAGVATGAASVTAGGFTGAGSAGFAGAEAGFCSSEEAETVFGAGAAAGASAGFFFYSRRAAKALQQALLPLLAPAFAFGSAGFVSFTPVCVVAQELKKIAKLNNPTPKKHFTIIFLLNDYYEITCYKLISHAIVNHQLQFIIRYFPFFGIYPGSGKELLSHGIKGDF